TLMRRGKGQHGLMSECRREAQKASMPTVTSFREPQGQMAVTVQMQFESVVTDLYQDAFVGSSIEGGTTIIQFDLRQLDFQRALGTTAPICWRQEPYRVDIHELSTFHNPIKYRFIVAQGSYLNDLDQRVHFTPDIQGVSTSQ